MHGIAGAADPPHKSKAAGKDPRKGFYMRFLLTFGGAVVNGYNAMYYSGNEAGARRYAEFIRDYYGAGVVEIEQVEE